MHADLSSTFSDFTCSGGVCVADGYGIGVRVRHKQLVVSDGIGRARRERVFSKATAGIRRLVIIGRAGSVSLEAMRWLADAGVALAHIDRDGTLLTSSGKFGNDDPRLRRAQALAREDARGIEIARHVLGAKLAGQRVLLDRLPDACKARTQLGQAIREAARAKSLDQILFAESMAAAAYWISWASLPLRFAKADERRLPAHWLSFGGRHSPIANGPRQAANPANAILNYLYAIAEAETRIACLAVGLDPGIGIWHADQRARDSLVLDLMEAIRPNVDLFVLELLQSRTFRGKDFFETPKGACRLLAPFTHVLAETAVSWRQAAAPIVEGVARMLTGDSAEKAEKMPTPLTQANRSAGRDRTRRKAKRVKPAVPKISRTCASCGEPVPDGRVHCDRCLPGRRAEVTGALQLSGPAALARMKAEGCDPRATREAKEKLARSRRARLQEEKDWNEKHAESDPAVFTEEILPGLKDVPLRRMSMATGLSRNYCSLVRRGLRVPHARHWEVLRNA